MSERSAKGCLLAAVIWCVIIAILGVAYKFLVHPRLRTKLQTQTSSSSQYKDQIRVAADSFSGYAILRSARVREELRGRQIKLVIQDDKADYAARLGALQKGEVDLAVFTIDSLLQAGAKAGEFPGTIVLVIDETKGSDAILARKSALPSLQDLDDPNARLVLTPNSPSEFLARVVIAHFELPRLPAQWSVPADGAGAVYSQLRAARSQEKRAYVLWEPYVSRALQQPDVHVLIDSSKLKGYIVDVLVAQRQFLRDRPDQVQTLIEAYCRAAYYYSRKANGLVELAREDAHETGSEKLDAAQAQQVVQGIQWKNTLENYAHFGIVPAAEPGSIQHLEDMIGNIMDVLVKTKAIPADPLSGSYHTLFYSQILAGMHAAGFHPGKGLNLIPGVGPEASETEQVRSDQALPALSPEEWTRLQPVGELKLEPIVFGRGSSEMSVASRRDLQNLSKRLQTFPQFYVRIIGHARAEGDADANRVLAQSRAETAADFLAAQGISRQRIRTEAAPINVRGGEAQAVSFVVGQKPY